MAVLEERPIGCAILLCAPRVRYHVCVRVSPCARAMRVFDSVELTFATMLYWDKHNIVDRLESEILDLTGIRLGLRL